MLVCYNDIWWVKFQLPKLEIVIFYTPMLYFILGALCKAKSVNI